MLHVPEHSARRALVTEFPPPPWTLTEVSTTRMIIVCTLTCSLVLWVGFVWAVVHFLA